METKHTKGEWESVGGDNYSCEVNIGNVTINVCRQDKNTNELLISREEMEANAKLIAAAPDLLEALVNLLNESNDLIDHCIDQGFVDFENTSIDGVTKINKAKEEAINAINKATS